MKNNNFCIEITAPEELGPVYDESEYFETELEAISFLHEVSGSDLIVSINSSIGDPAVGSELNKLGFEGRYELYTDTGFIGAVYAKKGA